MVFKRRLQAITRTTFPGHFEILQKNKAIVYGVRIWSDYAFYEASELLGTKEMTVREFIERIADVCRYIEAGSGEVKRGEIDDKN